MNLFDNYIYKIGGQFVFPKTLLLKILLELSGNKRDMRKKLFSGISTYTNSKVYLFNKNITSGKTNNRTSYMKDGGKTNLLWALFNEIVGSDVSGNSSSINPFFNNDTSVSDYNVFKNLIITAIDNSLLDEFNLNLFASLDEIMLEYRNKLSTNNIEILLGPDSKKFVNTKQLKPTKKMKEALNKVKESASSLDEKAKRVQEYIRSGATFYSPEGVNAKNPDGTKYVEHNLTWGTNEYKLKCSTGSYNVLDLLGYSMEPAKKHGFSVDLSGIILLLMGLSYLTTVDPKNPNKNGYTPRNGDTAVWPKFVRGTGKNKGTVTLHLATYLNGKWYSDTELSKMSAYSSDPNEPLVKIYRING